MQLILYFPDYQQQAQELAAELNISCSPVQAHYFPDGEVRIRLPEKLPDKVLFYRSLDNPNDKLIELLFATETARSLGAKHITLVAPYLCYMRQDIAFTPGDAISQRIIGSFLSRLYDQVVTVDPHLHRIHSLDDVMSKSKNIVLSASELIGEYVSEHLTNAILIGPDEESEQWVAVAAKRAALEYHVATKQRFGDRKVELKFPEMNIRGKTVVLMDDVISTGHTLSIAASSLKQKGAAYIYCIATHVLLSETDLDILLSNSVDAVVSTSSTNHSTNRISLSKLLADALA